MDTRGGAARWAAGNYSRAATAARILYWSLTALFVWSILGQPSVADLFHYAGR